MTVNDGLTNRYIANMEIAPGTNTAKKSNKENGTLRFFILMFILLISNLLK